MRSVYTDPAYAKTRAALTKEFNRLRQQFEAPGFAK